MSSSSGVDSIEYAADDEKIVPSSTLQLADGSDAMREPPEKRRRIRPSDVPLPPLDVILFRIRTHTTNNVRRRRSGLLPALSRAFNLTDKPAQVSGRRYRTSSSCELGLRVEREIAQALYDSQSSVHDESEFPPTRCVHRLTSWLLADFAERGWTLCAHNVALHDTVSGVFSFIDFIAYDERRKKYVLIELKTGYDRGYASALCARNAGRLRTVEHLPLLETRHDSFETRHQLQLAWMDWALRTIYDVPRRAFYSCIVRASNSRKIGVRQPVPLARWASSNSDKIAARLRERR